METEIVEDIITENPNPVFGTIDDDILEAGLDFGPG